MEKRLLLLLFFSLNHNYIMENLDNYLKNRDRVIDELLKRLIAFKNYENTHSTGDFNIAFPNIKSQIDHILEYNEKAMRELNNLFVE